MKRVIEFRQGDKTLFIEVEEEVAHRDQLSGRGGAIDKAKQSFEEAVAGIGPIADTVLRQVTALRPEAVSVEFGVKPNAQAGVILASSAVEETARQRSRLLYGFGSVSTLEC